MRMDERVEFTQKIINNLDVLCSISGRFPLTTEAKNAYVVSLYEYRSSKHLDGVFNDLMLAGVCPPPGEIIKQIRHKIEGDTRKLGADEKLQIETKRLAGKESVVSNPEHAICAYIKIRRLGGSDLTRDLFGSGVIDRACESMFGRNLSDDELFAAVPAEKIKSYLDSLN